MEKAEKTMSSNDDPMPKVGITLSLQGSALEAEETSGGQEGKKVLRRIDLW